MLLAVIVGTGDSEFTETSPWRHLEDTVAIQIEVLKCKSEVSSRRCLLLLTQVTLN